MHHGLSAAQWFLIGYAYWSLIPAIAGALIAGHKGRRRLDWGIGCWLFGLVGVFLVAVLGDRRGRGGEYEAWLEEQRSSR